MNSRRFVATFAVQCYELRESSVYSHFKGETIFTYILIYIICIYIYLIYTYYICTYKYTYCIYIYIHIVYIYIFINIYCIYVFSFLGKNFHFRMFPVHIQHHFTHGQNPISVRQVSASSIDRKGPPVVRGRVWSWISPPELSCCKCPLALKYIWLVVSTPLKNMKVNWDDYPQYMEK